MTFAWQPRDTYRQAKFQSYDTEASLKFLGFCTVSLPSLLCFPHEVVQDNVVSFLPLVDVATVASVGISQDAFDFLLDFGLEEEVLRHRFPLVS